jgi:hypothetical protein
MNDFFKIDPSSGNIILTKAFDNQTTKFDFILHASINQRNLFNFNLLTDNLNYILESVEEILDFKLTFLLVNNYPQFVRQVSRFEMPLNETKIINKIVG